MNSMLMSGSSKPRTRPPLVIEQLIAHAIKPELAAALIAVNPVVSRDENIHISRYDQAALALLLERLEVGIHNLDAVRLYRRRYRVFKAGESKLYRIGLGVPGAEIQMDVIESVECAYKVSDLEPVCRAGLESL